MKPHSFFSPTVPVDPEWANPMRRVQAAIRQLQPSVPVELAFEFMV